ncbi:MAG TPA: hypothetical protein VKM72_24385 [Thermoanaerobaculia bacterium]|nr:hypothetical protein [Thermoanaerobaculia bacterium]
MKERLVFLALILAYLVPIWAVDYLPTVDGPCHTYNAWVIRQHGNSEEYPQLGKQYVIDWRPLPNWLSHAVMALLMLVFDPRVAEKILVSGYVVLFPAAARYAAGAVDPARQWIGYLAFPLVYNQLFQLGFYNFSYSLAFWLFAVGYWWRRRESPEMGFAVRINLLLLLCWFCHIVSLALALLAIGVLWLATLWRVRRTAWKRHLLHVVILLPQIILPLWFLVDQPGGAVSAGWSVRLLSSFLFRFEVLFYFGAPQIWIGRILGFVFLLFLVLTLAGRLRSGLRDEDGFLLLSLLLVAVYVVSPEGMSGGGLLKQRLVLYPWLAMLPWLAPRFPERWGVPVRAATIGALAVLALWSAGYVLRQHQSIQPALQAYLRPAEHIRPNSRVLPLLSDRGPYGFYNHLFSYVAIEKGLIDWNNYEATTQHFPTRFHRGRHAFWWIARAAEDIDLRSPDLTARVDYVYTWSLNPASSQALHLRRHYRLVYEEGPARLYRPKRGQRAKDR